MKTYTVGVRSSNKHDVQRVFLDLRVGFAEAQHKYGMDGLDVMLGTIEAMRWFVREQVGPEAVGQELANLAEVLKNGLVS